MTSLQVQKKSPPPLFSKKTTFTLQKKNVLTILSLVLTGVLLLGLSSVLASVNARDMSMQGFPRGHFIVRISDDELRNNSLEQVQENNPLTNNLLEEFSAISRVEKITEYRYLPVAINTDATESELSVVSFDNSDMPLIEECADTIINIDYNTIVENNGIIIGRPTDFENNFNIHAEIGQTLILKIFDGTNRSFTGCKIVGILDESKMGDNGDKIDMLMLPSDAMKELTNANTAYQWVIQVPENMEPQAEIEMNQILDGISGVQLDTLSGAIEQNNNFIQGMKLALLIAIAFIGCFAVMNLTNTILTGTITRNKEFALMRSVGMTQRQLHKMVCYESATTSSIGLLCSVIIGGGIGIVLCTSLKTRLMTYLNYHFPVLITVVFCSSVLLCTIIVTNATLKHQSKFSLIEQLRE